MTDVDRRSAGRLMASTALFKNLIFIKCFGFSAGTSLLKNMTYDVRMTSLLKQLENLDHRDTRQIIYHSKGNDESFPKM